MLVKELRELKEIYELGYADGKKASLGYIIMSLAGSRNTLHLHIWCMSDLYSM